MPIAKFKMPDGRVARFEVPEGTTPEQAEQLIAEAMPQVQAQEPTASPTDNMSFGQKFGAGYGKAAVDLYRGAKQIDSQILDKLGVVGDVLRKPRQLLGMDESTADIQAEIDAAKKRDAPLMQSAGGMIGNIAGNVINAAPALAIPGANTVAGATALGALQGGLQPVATGEDRLKNAAFGAAAGGVGQKAGNVIGSRIMSSAAAKQAAQQSNAVRDATLEAAKEAGYVVPPSMSNASMIPRLLEGISGKYKTNQLASIKNQKVTDQLSRKAVGIAENEPITSEVLQTIRNEAYKAGYEPVKAAGEITVDNTYKAALDAIVSKYQGAARSFPKAAKNDVADFVENLRVDKFDAGDAIDQIRILREGAEDAFGSGQKALGKAQRSVANALEEQIERYLTNAGKDGGELLKSFREARTLMAKTHTIEKAVKEGGGSVDAKVIARDFQKGKPLSGDLKTIGQFANNFGDVAGMPKSGYANPLTVLDFGYAGLGGGLVNPAMVALPAARVASRYSLLSNPVQRMLKPDYSQGLFSQGLQLAAPRAGLLGSSIQASQQ